MILGISGKIGVGKSTFTDYFLKFNPDWNRISFGDPIKEECSAMLHYPLEWNHTTIGKNTLIWVPPFKGFSDFLFTDITQESFFTVRQILQMRGNGMRTVDKNYWVKKLQEKLTDRHTVIDDVRHAAEANFVIKDAENFLMRIQPYDGWTPGPNADHVSEIELDNYGLWDLKIKPTFGELEDIAEYFENFELAKNYF